MKCADCQDLLLDLLYQELSPPARAEAEKHLAACPECAREFARLQETVSAFRALPDPEVPPFLNARVLAHAREQAARPRTIWSYIMRPSVVTAFLAVMAVTVYVISGGLRLKEEAPLAPAMTMEKLKSESKAAPLPAAGAPAPPPTPAPVPAPAGSGARDDRLRKLETEKPAPAASTKEETTNPAPLREKSPEPKPAKPAPPPLPSEKPAPTLVPETHAAVSQPPAPAPSTADELARKREERVGEKKADFGAAGLLDKDREAREEAGSAGGPVPEKTAANQGPGAPPAGQPSPAVADQARGQEEKSSTLGYNLATPQPSPPGDNQARPAPAPASAPGEKAKAGPVASRTPSGLIREARELDAASGPRAALPLYEQALAMLGYRKGQAKTGGGVAAKSQAENAPSSTAENQGETKPQARCSGELNAAVQGALRDYKKLGRFSDARALQKWYSSVCP